MDKIQHYNSKRSLREIKKKSVSLKDFKKQFSKKDLKDIEREKKYLEVLMEIRKERKKKGLTQEELAEKAEIPRTTITKIESGNRNVTIETLMNIASAMGKQLEIKLR